MRINFQQGIIKYPHSGVIQQFLSKVSNTVNLNTSNGHVDVAFAHGASNYLLTEIAPVTAAWSGIPSNTDTWLYWDIDKRTGVRTFGYTLLAPTNGPTAPGSPAQDQHWFNTSSKKMYVYNSGAFREVIRVFAAKVNNTTFTPLGTNVAPTQFAGSQVGLTNISTAVGRILYDGYGTPVRKPSGELFTTEDDFLINGSPANAIRLESNVIIAEAIETVAKYHVVKFVGTGQVEPAGYDDAGEGALAITVEDIISTNTGSCILQGVVTNPGWDWPTIGATLWVLENGALVDTDPHVSTPLVYTTSRVGVGRVLSPTSIMFTQAIGGKGEQGDPGAPGSAPSLTLNDLTDTVVASPLTAQVLRYNGSAWVNATLPTIPSSIDDLSDVTISAPAANNVITYSGGSWVNAPVPTPSLAIGDLTNVTITGTPSVYEVLRADGVGGWVNELVLLEYLDVNSTAAAATAGGLHAIALGSGATASGSDSLAVGTDAVCGAGTASIAIGASASAASNYASAFGPSATVSHINSIVIGRAASTSTDEVTIADNNPSGNRIKVKFDSLHRMKPRAAVIEAVVPLVEGSPTVIPSEQGNIYTVSVTADRTITVTNAIAGTNFSLEVTNDGTARVLTFGTGFTSIKWPGGTQPPSTVGIDVYTLYTIDGTNWRAALAVSYDL